MYRNFKLCTADGNRVAVFIRPINDETEVYILKCAKKDRFSKKKATEAYNNWLNEGQSFFTEKIKKDRGHEKKRVECAPYINLLPVKYDSFNKINYLRSFFKTFVSASYVSQVFRSWVEFFEDANYYVEPNCLNKVRR